MKGIKYKLKKNYKLIIGIMFFVILIGSAFIGNLNTVYGKTNTVYQTSAEAGSVDVDQAVSESTLLYVIAHFVYAIAGFIENMVSGIVGSITGEAIFPWADRVLFNSLSFLDVNFLNPENGSLFRNINGNDTAIGTIIRNLYYTIFVIAISFFGVIVGIMSLKLVFSTIASEKAKYKQAIQNWLLALILIFTAHYLMSFIFFINEKMVEIASSILMNQDFDVNIDTESMSEDETAAISVAMLENVFTGHFNTDVKPGSAKGIISLGAMNAAGINIYSEDDTVYAIGIGDDLNGNPYHTIKAYKNHSSYSEYCSILTHPKSYLVATAWADIEARDDDNLKSQWDKNIARLLSQSGYIQGGGTDSAIELDNEGDVYAVMIDAVYLTLIQNKYHDYLYDETKFISGIRSVVSYFNAQFTTEIYDLSNKFGSGELEDHYKSFWGAVQTLYSGSDDVGSEVFTGIAEFFKNNIYAVTIGEDDNGKTTVSNFNEIPAILYSIFVVQSIMYFIAYLKRFFYIIILALFAPLVIIYDFLSKTLAT